MDFFILFLLGTLFGSFANAYFYRYCQNVSIIFPNSFCPHCRNPIRWFDNIPILSFLALKARCRSCGRPISWTYPFGEFLCGLLFLTVYAALIERPPAVIAAFLFLYFIIFLIAGTDLATYFETGMEYGIIPDSLVVILSCVGALFSFFNPFLEWTWWRSLAGGAAGYTLSLAIRWTGEKLFKKEALGMGDVKFIGAIGLIFGWEGIFSTLLFGSLTGSAVSIALIASKKIRRDSAVPFGPFLALGSLSGLFL